MRAADTHRTIDAVWRIESPRLIAGLVRMVRDVGVAEDLAQDALVAALEQWPQSGIPDNPGAWLMATAKHRAIDRFRRNTRLERKLDEFGRELAVAAIDAAMRAGYRTMRLDTLPSTVSARELYRSLGFEATPAYYDTPVPDTLFMRKTLVRS